MRRKKFNLKKEYKDSWNYIKESKNFIYFIIGVFFVFALIGFFVPASEEITKIILEFIEKLLEQTKDMSQGELIGFIFANNLQSSFFGLFLGIILGIFPVFAAITNGYVLGFVGAMSVEIEGGFILLNLLPHGIFELPAIFISLGMGLKLGIKPIVNYFLINKKRDEILKGVLSLISLLFALLFFVGAIGLLTNPSFVESLNPNISFLLSIFFFALGVLSSSPFIYLFLFTKSFRELFFNSLRVFLFVVLPLLIIAAIIEGCLIFIG